MIGETLTLGSKSALKREFDAVVPKLGCVCVCLNRKNETTVAAIIFNEYIAENIILSRRATCASESTGTVEYGDYLEDPAKPAFTE